MLKLQPIAGLYQLIAKLRGQAAWNREKAKAAHTDPRLAHEADLSAADDEKKADKLESHARANEAAVNIIELLIHDFTTSSHASAARTLAMRDLESASMRLRRELGDPEECSKPKAPPGTIPPPLTRTW